MCHFMPIFCMWWITLFFTYIFNHYLASDVEKIWKGLSAEAFVFYFQNIFYYTKWLPKSEVSSSWFFYDVINLRFFWWIFHKNMQHRKKSKFSVFLWLNYWQNLHKSIHFLKAVSMLYAFMELKIVFMTTFFLQNQHCQPTVDE